MPYTAYGRTQRDGGSRDKRDRKRGRDDVLIDYIAGRVSEVVARAIEQRAAIDPSVQRRIDELRTHARVIRCGTPSVDEKLPPEWLQILGRLGH